MRERLIELLNEAREKCANTPSKNCKECSGYGKGYGCISALIADYLLTNGIIVPPCKVGDRLYWINRVSEEVETDRVIALHLYETKFVITTSTVGRKSTTTYDLNRLLEIMYFTKEEAEAALKGGAE